jgi:hypothetical protein
MSTPWSIQKQRRLLAKCAGNSRVALTTYGHLTTCRHLPARSSCLVLEDADVQDSPGTALAEPSLTGASKLLNERCRTVAPDSPDAARARFIADPTCAHSGLVRLVH